jgi:DNA-binding CsgD family transcriptional regulator/thioredoxin-like negative regulator of GroEL
LDARSAAGPPVAATGDLIAHGRSALRSGDAAGARRAFETALQESPENGDVLEGMARAAYLDLDFSGAIEHWHAAYAAHRAAGNQVGAIRAARTLGYMHGAVMGDGAVMSGWIARAQTLLADAADSAEAGWVSLNLGMFETDRVRKEAYFSKALDVARRVGDEDLEFVTLAYLGASLVHADRTEEGMVLLDEALAAVAGGDVDDFFVLEEIFCQLFAACERAHDVGRADQWMRIGEEIASRRNLPAVSAFCRTHYGGVLTAAGRWPEADVALTEAVRLWGLGYRSLRAGALVRLADLRVRQGRFEEAEQLLDGLRDNVDAAPAVAAIELARTRTALARHVLDRALEPLDATSAAAAPLLAQLVDVHLAAGDLDEAAAAAEQLARCADRHQSDYLLATAALVRGLVCLATGVGDPRVCLNEARAGFSRAQMPMEVARSRLELAAALAAERPEAAIAEARAALEGFQRLQAARHADAAAALLRSLGARAATVKGGGDLLTKREAEVLELLGHGLSNPEIADRLYISRKTVEHHVGNILAKLGLRSRGEAAAYATRTRPAPK